MARAETTGLVLAAERLEAATAAPAQMVVVVEARTATTGFTQQARTVRKTSGRTLQQVFRTAPEVVQAALPILTEPQVLWPPLGMARAAPAAGGKA